MSNYKLIHNVKEFNKFIYTLPELKDNEGYFIILIARKKWYPESGIASAHKLKRETVSSKDKILRVIKQWEAEDGSYMSGNLPVHQNNLGVYIGYNPKNQYNACFELINQCLANIKSNKENINVKSMANDVIQGSNGTKNFMDIDVDIKEGEDYLKIKEFIESVINKKYLTFIKTNGGFHCLVSLIVNAKTMLSKLEYKAETYPTTTQEDFSLVGKNWYQKLQHHPFYSELNIMSNDLVPLCGCNQGKFTPYIFE